MRPSVFLDEHGDAKAPLGIPEVRTEREFLQAVVLGESFVVRGKLLSRWARLYYAGRDAEVVVLLSPVDRLLQLCSGAITKEEAQLLLSKADNRLKEDPNFTLVEVANAIWPSAWWSAPPDSAKAANWLCWLACIDPASVPPGYIIETARELAEGCACEEKDAFAISDPSVALNWLWWWLEGDSRAAWTLPFPAELPVEVKSRLRTAIRSRAVATRGEYFLDVVRAGADAVLLRMAADACGRYFAENSENLTQEKLTLLTQWVDPELRNELRNKVPPADLSAPPSSPDEYARWFVESYLPYRQWAGPVGDAAVHTAAAAFGRNYLEMYRVALRGGPGHDSLAWNRSSSVAGADEVTLVVVADGLTYEDMATLWRFVSDLDVGNRLEVESHEVVFAPVPTITEIGKPSVVKGVAPKATSEQPELGTYLARQDEVADALAKSELGQVVLWNVLEPDATYHSKLHAATPSPGVNGALYSVAQNLVEVVSATPSRVRLKVVVTTDHGRLMQASQRDLLAPEGMRVHGRAALGGSSASEPLRVHEGIAYLHRDSFGLTEDAAVVLSAASFKTDDGRSGTESFPHGGVYPEEVLIPWWVIVRDRRLQPLKARLCGKAVAGRQGTLLLQLLNECSVTLVAHELELTFGSEATVYTIGSKVGPMSSCSVQISLAHWPTAAEVKAASGRLLTLMPDSSLRAEPVEISIETEDMYEEEENPLAGLL